MDARPLWQHQELALKAALVVQDLGLFFEMGTGKTRTMIEILRRVYAKENRVMKTLILCPPVVCRNWKDEFGMFSKIDQNNIVILSKTSHRRIKDFTHAVGDDLSRSKIIITNYESMDMKELYGLLLKWQPEILVCDESQRLKNHDSKRAKAVVGLADTTRHNYILTGTPILNSPMDVYMQFRVLDRGEMFGKNWFAFKSYYMQDRNAQRKGTQGYFPKWEPKPNSYDELKNKISKKSLRVLKKDCLDLPPFIRQDVTAELSPEQIRMYKEMFTEYITFIDSKEAQGEKPAVVAQLAVTKALRLQQIVTGFVKDEDGTIHRIDCPRLKVLKELLEDLVPENKVIVWSIFKENYKMIAELCDALDIKYTELHGDLTSVQKNKSMDQFRNDPEIKVMIANQSAGGVGVNLIEANYSIYYSKGFKLEDDLQSEARNYRGGSEMHAKVTRIDIVARGTIDELITTALKDKQNISDKILTWRNKICEL